MRTVISPLDQHKFLRVHQQTCGQTPARTQKGFVLIAMCACMFLLLAAVGLAFDLGRIYIVRNEAQVFVDAGAMAAAAQLDGTAAGINRARAAVEHLPGRWNMAAEAFRGVTVEFSNDGEHWLKPGKKTETQEAAFFARVTAPSNSVEVTFLRAVGGPDQFTVPAHAMAASHPVRLVE